MIRYTLQCENEHRFESWFASAEAFEALERSGHLACPDCGASKVAKTLMSPGVSTSRKKAAAPDLAKPEDDRAKALAALRKKVEAESDYVGLKFASEARAMHDGDIPHRSIYGEAKAEDAKKLIEDGVPVAPLPFMPKAKTN